MIRARMHAGPRWAAVLAAATSLLATGMAPLADELPNLRPAAPIGLEVGSADDGSGPAFRFTTLTWNVGDFHLDLTGVPDGPDHTAALQCVSWEAERGCLERAEVGEFVWHPTHAHFHFDDYAAYELRTVLADGTPNLSEAGLLATGGKVSFCLMDTDRGPNGATSVLLGWYLACQTGNQGISQGWGDTYTKGLDGQQIEVPDDLGPGTYAVVIHVNPHGIVRETDHQDNRSWVVFEFNGRRNLRILDRYEDVPSGTFVNPVPVGTAVR